MRIQKIPTLATLALALGAGAYFGVPYLVKQHKQKEVHSLIAAFSNESKSLNKKIGTCEKYLQTNEFLLSKDEKETLERDLSNSKKIVSDLDGGLINANDLFYKGQYDNARIILDNNSRESQKKEGLLELINKVDNNIIKVRENIDIKLKIRNNNIDLEWYLKARLKRPIIEGTEPPEDFTTLPITYQKFVPIIDTQIDKNLKELPKELYNSLGMEILSNREELQEILTNCKVQRIKDKSQNIINKAQESYTQVMPINDTLLWYRTERDDGKLTLEQHKDLLKKQNEAVRFIRQGESALAEFDNYKFELQDQWYEYVSQYNKSSALFNHQTIELQPQMRMDSDGDLHIEMVAYPSNQITKGMRFSYALRKITPEGVFDTFVDVGEKDSFNDAIWERWDYKQNETIRYITGWKKPYEDKQMIQRGGLIKELRPSIQIFQKNIK